MRVYKISFDKIVTPLGQDEKTIRGNTNLVGSHVEEVIRKLREREIGKSYKSDPITQDVRILEVIGGDWVEA